MECTPHGKAAGGRCGIGTIRVVHERWRTADRLLLVGVVVLGVAIRVALWGVEGFPADMDQFADWIAHISTAGLGQLYTENPGGPVTFGPVMGYVWWLLGVVQPAFASATDASAPALNALMKVPASLADLGMAAVAVWALRDRPRWAVVGAAAILLVPVTWYVSAWWGQYESIYVLPALAGVVAATRGRNGLAAALLAVALATKPQAIPLVLPFVAWCWAQGGWRELVRCGLIGGATFAVLWLPFVPAGGPVAYLANVRYYQDEVFNVLSVRAWNPWSLLQELVAGGEFIADDVPIVGPVTLRWVGYAVTGALSLVVMAAVVRDPRPRTLMLATAASCLVFFLAMTQMHERYAYAAVILPVLLLAEPQIRTWWLLLAGVVTLNLVAAIPPAEGLGAALPSTGPLAIAGALAMTASATVGVVILLARSEDWRASHA